MTSRGPRGIGFGLLLVCFMLAFGGRQEGEIAAGNRMEVEEPPLAALTFDDGPNPRTTGPLLEELSRREVPATFFLVGACIPGNEDLIRRMAAEGHQIGVHTYSHVKLTEQDEAHYRREVDSVRAQLTEILGEGDYWLRPPYGILDEQVRRRSEGPLVLWSVDPEDWRDRNTDRIVEAVLSRVQDGDIILLHDIYGSSTAAALRIADGLLERGYCLVTVRELMELRGREPEQGRTVCACPPDTLPH